MAQSVLLKTGFSLDLKRDIVWRYMHTRKTVDSLNDEVDWAIGRVKELAEPKAGFLRLGVVSIDDKGISLEGGVELESPALRSFFQGAEVGLLVGFTIGPGPEEEANELFTRGDMVKGLVLDSAASALAHSIADQVHRDAFVAARREGLRTGPCLSPGSPYWDLTGQRALFSALRLDKLGMRLLTSCFIYPRKSQTRVIPQGRDLVVRSNPDESHCNYCTNKYCLARRE